MRMLASLILIASLAALLQFLVAYTRSLLRTYSKIELSPDARRLAGFEENPDENSFQRVVFLLKLVPENSGPGLELFVIRGYYLALGLLAPARHLWPALAYWITAEKENCAYFAAVRLDQRMASSKNYSI